MKISALPCAVLIAGMTVCPALAQSLYAPPDGLVLQTTTGQKYGGMPTYNWMISQWSTPDQLPPFALAGTKNETAMVVMNQDGSFNLAQNGQINPCWQNGSTTIPNEFDLYGSPLLVLTPLPVLSAMTALVMAGTVSGAVGGPLDTTCTINGADLLISMILKDPVASQTFFYQIPFSLYGIAGHTQPKNPPPAQWFMKGLYKPSGTQFGYADPAWTSYGVAPLVPNTPTPYALDVLPLMEDAIAAGAAFGMDQNLANWHVSSEYVGEAIWGHTLNQSKWSNLSLTAAP